MKNRALLLVLFTLTAFAGPAGAQDPTEPLPGAVPFESFKVQGSIQFPQGDAKSGSLSVRAQFTPGLGDGIFPGSEDVTLVIEPEPSQTNVPPAPCNIVALPAGCLVPHKNGGWTLGDGSVRTCNFQFFLLFPGTNTKVDLTPFVTDVGVRLTQSPTDKSWELKLQIDLAGLPAVIPNPPCNIVATIGNDRGATHVTSKLDFFGVIAPEN